MLKFIEKLSFPTLAFWPAIAIIPIIIEQTKKGIFSKIILYDIFRCKKISIKIIITGKVTAIDFDKSEQQKRRKQSIIIFDLVPL